MPILLVATAPNALARISGTIGNGGLTPVAGDLTAGSSVVVIVAPIAGLQLSGYQFTGSPIGLVVGANRFDFTMPDHHLTLSLSVLPTVPFPGLVGNVNPADGATGVETDTSISWTAATDAVSYDVYFTADTGSTILNVLNQFRGNQTGLSWNPPSNLSYNTTHLWRIDAINASGKRAGDAQAFTTVEEPPPTEYCLTTEITYGEGTITQVGVQEPGGPYWEGCNGDARDQDDLSCAWDYPEGLVGIELLAVPASGYNISLWRMTRHSNGQVIDTVPPWDAQPGTNGTVRLTMPSFDVDVQVQFVQDNVTLTVITDGSGCVILRSPIVYSDVCYSGTANFSIAPGSVILEAVPNNNNYIFSHWVDINGDMISDDGTSLLSFILGTTSSTVYAYFIIAPTCILGYNLLTVAIVGSGSVSHPTGSYCADPPPLAIVPIPNPGNFFKGWQYDIPSVGIEENGIILNVTMSIPQSITAIFGTSPDAETPGGNQFYSYDTLEGNQFYCASTTNRNNVVSFNFTNDRSDPSVYGDFHFRVNFYSDSDKQKLLYSASSLASNKRWFYNIDAFEPLPINGIFVESGDTVNIIYDPEILPQQITENQMEKIIDSNIYESPLVCGVKYYIDIESYNPVAAAFSFVETISLILDCDDVDSYYWNYNDDDNNWLCSGQGKVDLQVTSSSQSQSILSDVSSNIYGLYQIVWQTRRDGVYQVYGAMWDSETDVLYSSGQGGNDELKLIAGYDPIVLTDQANNFYIAGYTTEGTSFSAMISHIYINACPISVLIPGTPVQTSTDLFVKLCSPGMDVYLSNSYDQIKARVYKEDISGSLVVNNNKVVPIIKKKTIRLDIDGIEGAYAVRLRNINDPDWGGWINIDNNLYYTGAVSDNVITEEDVSYDAYRIDNSRFIVLWDVGVANGLRRVCCQVLTLYGITNVFCLDLFFNFDTHHHIFKFYTDAGRQNEFPIHNGQYILSLKDANGDIVTGDVSTVYFEAIFDESIETEGLTFNVIQQGINDIWGQSISVEDSKTISGSFELSKEDGIFNKDGNSFIEIVFPELTTPSTCSSDSSDLYNLMITDIAAAEYKDLVPEEVYNRIQTNKAGRVFEPNQFKQYYDQDDSNFKFGNPGYFRE